MNRYRVVIKTEHYTEDYIALAKSPDELKKFIRKSWNGAGKANRLINKITSIKLEDSERLPKICVTDKRRNSSSVESSHNIHYYSYKKLPQ